MTKYLAAMREPHGRIHFAGGDFALDWRGFIDGAIESGNREAQAVIARLAGRPDRTAAVRPQAPAHTAELAPVDAAFQQCAVCHPTDASGRPGFGPNLRGVVGRPAASDPSYAYSETLRSRTHRWTDEELDAFLSNPPAYASGTIMPFAGLKDPADRAAVIRYLRDLK
jgi:cytochrome c2